MTDIARGARKPTMGDVARRAGVSSSTVSVVVNGRDEEVRISSRTKARVLAAVEELGFRPNLAARNLRLQRTRTIGFVTDFIAGSPFAGRTVLGAQDAAWAHGHLLLLVNTGGDAAIEKTAIETLIDRQVDSMLYAAMAWGPVDLPAEFATVPSMLVNCWSDGRRLRSDHPAVGPAEVRGEALATQAVLDAGHRAIAMLAGPAEDAATVARERGFRTALAGAGVRVHEEWVSYIDGDIASGYRAALRLLERPDRPTAVVCWNDRIAVGVIIAALEEGLRVPRDLSVVGYDDQEGLADLMSPALTTVSIPHYDMGRTAVEAVLAGVETGRDPESCEVAGRLMRRGSLGPVPPTR